MNASFWSGRKVLLTGHTGFKGAWLCLLLERLGAKVTGYSLPPPTDPSLFELARVDGAIRSVQADVRDLDRLQTVFGEVAPEVVIHLAAQSLVRASYREPVRTYSTNVLGTVHVLEAARGCPSVRAVVNVTSDKCYRNDEQPSGHPETDPMGGDDPYSSSKACAELVTHAYRRSFFNPDSPAGAAPGGGALAGLASARAGNVIGGGDWAPDRLVPDCVRAILRGEPVLVRRPQAIRPWQFVLDPLAGYLLLVEKLWESPAQYGGAWNFGPDDADARSVEWVVQRVTQLWGPGAAWEPDSRAHPHEAGFLRLDCSKARRQLGWSPRMDLETAMQWTVDWYRGHQAGQDIPAVSRRQVDDFLSLQGVPA